jgi:hypothetical protein
VLTIAELVEAAAFGVGGDPAANLFRGSAHRRL